MQTKIQERRRKTSQKQRILQAIRTCHFVQARGKSAPMHFLLFASRLLRIIALGFLSKYSPQSTNICSSFSFSKKAVWQIWRAGQISWNCILQHFANFISIWKKCPASFASSENICKIGCFMQKTHIICVINDLPYAYQIHQARQSLETHKIL